MTDSWSSAGRRAELGRTRANRSVYAILKVACFALFVIGPVFVGVQAANAQGDEVWTLVREANDAIEDWDYPTADSMIGSLEEEFGDHPGVQYIRGKYLYHMGEYHEAVDLLDNALSRTAGMTNTNIQSLRDLVSQTEAVTYEYATYLTDDGLFEIRYDASRDEVLMPFLAETLEGAYYNVGYSIGYWPETPIRVEIYPRARTLAAVSSLTEEAVETSGTIALCKYNKLMFTSPRATARGYGWRDTVSHEYVHYAVSHLVNRSLPIWLHEALAKFLESRWTGTYDMRMDPSAEDLLGERVADDNLITFEQMHPSMAYLPSQEDASTAYAQVFTVMEYMTARRGHDALRDLLYTLRTGVEVEDAIAIVMDEPFRVFERNWMAYLRERPRVEIPGQFRDEVQLLPEDAEDESVDELAGVDAVEARDHLHLGELLRARDHLDGALQEYERAEALLGTANPVLQNALARTHLDLANPADALEDLEEVVNWYPDYYRTHLHMGEALNALGRFDEALPALDRAVGVNPFDPAVLDAMAVAYDAIGEPEMAAQMRQYIQIVRN